MGGECEVTRLPVGDAEDASNGAKEGRAEVGALAQVGGPVVVVAAIVVEALAARGALTDDLPVGLEAVFQTTADVDAALGLCRKVVSNSLLSTIMVFFTLHISIW
jgi:hypothetical protein